jgi:hypothetical protein
MREVAVPCVDELDDVVLELCRRHPRFRRVTIERLIARTARVCEHECPQEPLPCAVRRIAGEQLRYLDDLEARRRTSAIQSAENVDGTVAT